MLSKSVLKKGFVWVSCCLYVILFTYAATSKVLDFENFTVQLGQSPILSPFALPVAFGIPAIEFFLAALLFTRYRLAALHLSTALMIMFTFYIYIVLNHSSYVPCSCGGVLEKLNWTQHLIFNLAFVAMGLVSILISAPVTKRSFLKICLSGMASCLLVLLLFLASEDLIQNDNPFIRRFPPHVADYRGQTELQFNSYYIAGFDNQRLYLGNYSARLRLWSVGRTLSDKIEHKIIFEDTVPKFKRNVFRVQDGRFYILDGNVPSVHSGPTSNWKAKSSIVSPPFFTAAQPMDSVTIAVSATSGLDNSNVLATVALAQKKESVYPHLLQRQSATDGLFDTDGSLIYNTEINGIVYVYRYRNEYFVANRDGSLRYRSNTIDTVSKVQIKVASLKERKERKMAAPPLVVNADVATFRHLLFVRSTLRGKFDDKFSWERAATIDVYDLRSRKYILSFYINDEQGKRMRGFTVTPKYIYALIDTKLVAYDVNNLLKSEMTRYDTIQD